MSYIGAEPTTAAFPFDQFSGDGTTTAFTLTYAPASTTSIVVAISGVVQNPNLYSVVGTTLTFSPAPPSGTSNIAVLYLGLPVIGSSSPGNTAFLSATDLTATASQTVFASAGSYTPGFVQVYRNGARLGNADFTATNGTTITLANAATAGDLVTIEYYTLTSLTNALPLTGGTVTGSTTFNTGVNLAAVSGNVGVGTTSLDSRLNVKAGANTYTGGAIAVESASAVKTYITTISDVMYFGNSTSVDMMALNANGIALGPSVTAASSGVGIKFPATQSASSNANTLDDYEEGTWTPSLEGSGGSSGQTYNQRNGTYVKIGRMVFVTVDVGLTTAGTNSGTYAFLTGFPFSSAGPSGISFSPVSGYFANFAVATATVGLQQDTSANYAYFTYTTGAQGASTFAAASFFANNCRVSFQGCYQTAA